MDKSRQVAKQVVDELASCGIELVCSLPDNWISELVEALDTDERFTHVPVNREEAAVGMCAGAYMGGTPSAALMGASGLTTLIYAMTKINFTYEIPLCILTTLRGAFGDHHKHHASNGLYLLPILDAISVPYTIIDKPEDIGMISRGYHHSRTFSRPTVVAMTRDFLR